MPDTEKRTKKMRGKILMGGSMTIAGPDILEQITQKKEIDAFYEANHVEFNLKIEEAKKYGFAELTPFFDLSNADVDILTEARDDNQICDSFSFEFKDGGERGLELNLSIDQARALAEILQKYILVRDSWSRLQEPFHASL